MAYFGPYDQFWLFCCKFTRFWVYFVQALIMWQCTKNGKYLVWRAHMCRYVRAQTIICLLKNCIYDPAASIGSWPTPIVSTRSPSYSGFTLMCTNSVLISYIQEFTLTYTISVYTTYILECKCDILYCIVALPFRLHTANQPGANIVPIYKHTCYAS